MEVQIAVTCTCTSANFSTENRDIFIHENRETDSLAQYHILLLAIAVITNCRDRSVFDHACSIRHWEVVKKDVKASYSFRMGMRKGEEGETSRGD